MSHRQLLMSFTVSVCIAGCQPDRGCDYPPLEDAQRFPPAVEFDSALALVNLSDAERLFRLPGPTAVRLRLGDTARRAAARRRRARRASRLGSDSTARSQTERAGSDPRAGAATLSLMQTRRHHAMNEPGPNAGA